MNARVDRWFWILCFAACLSIAGHALLGYFHPVWQPDSDSYLLFQWDWGSLGWSGTRTPGYPFIAQTVISMLGLDWLPLVHTILYLGSVLFLYRSMARIGFRCSSAAAVCLPLLFGRAIAVLGPKILSDTPAVACSLLAVSFFLRTWLPEKSVFAWLGLAFTTLATCLIRPAFLFLIVLWPLLSLWFTYWLCSSKSRAECWRRFMLNCLAGVVPILLYSSIRWFAIGHFGVVAFTGFNLIGIASQALDPPMIASLPKHLQELATEIIKEADKKGVQRNTSSFHNMERNFDLPFIMRSFASACMWCTK